MGNIPPAARYRVDQMPPAPQRRRILVLAKAKRHTRITEHLIRGFRSNGHEVLWLRWGKMSTYLGERLAWAMASRRVERFRPDMALVYKNVAPVRFLDEVLASIPKAGLMGDLFEECNEELLETFRRCSILFITSRGQIADYERAGVPKAAYIRKGCSLDDHFPVRPDRAYAGDVAFIGAANMPNRTELLRTVGERFALDLYGQGWEKALGRRPRRRHVYPKQYRKICASTKCLIGIDKRADVDLYFSNRTWLTLGCGGFLLTQYVPNLEEFFNNHEHLVWFRSPEECVELIRHYLPREEERRRIAMSGCEYVRTYHTFRHATAEIVARTFGEPW